MDRESADARERQQLQESTGRIGFTITAQEISLPGLSYQAPMPIP